ncbi:MAG TPA: transglutaminase domain-containing protein [Ruminiclostridium sp.]|nr:transglutaminase domain-containing protein [Ruminiclostridium sp.]
MKKRVQIFVLLCILATVFCTASIFWQNAYAANDTASTLEELQGKISTAMNSRLTAYTVDYSGNLTSLQSDISSVINNIYEADDYMHYSSKGYRYTSTLRGGVATINFTFSYWTTAVQADFVSTTVNSVLSQIITPEMNDYQKEKAIHDWIMTKVAYDTTLAQHSDYAALVSPYKTVCQGYALLGYKMLNQVGIQTKILEGTAGNQEHVWNEVQLDGVWYHLDPTWDDPVPDVAGRVTYSYYNLTDDQIKVNHIWTKSYPTANKSFGDTLTEKVSGDASNAAFYQDLYDTVGLQYATADNTADSSLSLSTKLQQAIQNQQTELVVRYTNKSTLAADLKTAVTNMGNITSFSYSYGDYTRTTDPQDVLVSIKFTSTVVAVIVAVPPPVAFTTPAVTVATFVSLVVQTIFLLLALAGVIVGTNVTAAPPRVIDTVL